MNYCVAKGTTTVIDGSNNTFEKMIQNAINAGFTQSEIEILTEEEYQARNDLEPQPEPQPSKDEELLNYILDVDFRVIMLEMGLI